MERDDDPRRDDDQLLRVRGPRPYVLVGEAPNRATQDRSALWLRPDASGARHSANLLAEAMGASVEEYLAVFDRTNVLPYWPGRDRRSKCGGNYFPQSTARAIVDRRADEWLGRSLVLLGTRVATAFGLARAGSPGVGRARAYRWFEWVRIERFVGCRAAVMPHPNGRSRWWNSPENKRAARVFLRGLVERERTAAPARVSALASVSDLERLTT